MAKRRRKTSSRSGGSTLFGVMIGLILGLIAAVAVALFVTKVPMPFVDKASRDPAQVLLPDVRNAPDPNLALRGKNDLLSGSDAAPPAGPGTPPPSPDAIRSGDNLGDLIATLASGPRDRAADRTDPASPDAPRQGENAASAPAGTGGNAVIPGVTEPSSAEPAPSSAGTQTRYFLQAGAFRSEQDAESIKARILMLGLQAQVQKAQVGGSTINRVRVGPFTGIDDMNRARSRLGSENIETSVVRP